jgi:hypothetical protein
MGKPNALIVRRPRLGPYKYRESPETSHGTLLFGWSTLGTAEGLWTSTLVGASSTLKESAFQWHSLATKVLDGGLSDPRVVVRNNDALPARSQALCLVFFCSMTSP